MTDATKTNAATKAGRNFKLAQLKPLGAVALAAAILVAGCIGGELVQLALDGLKYAGVAEDGRIAIGVFVGLVVVALVAAKEDRDELASRND